MEKRNALQLVLTASQIMYSIKLMQTRLASLHSKVALLDQSHVAAAVMRLQVMIIIPSLWDALFSLLIMIHTLQGLLGSIKEIKKEQSLLQAAESQSKVSEIYNAVQKWDSVATLLPDLVCEHFLFKPPH